MLFVFGTVYSVHCTLWYNLGLEAEGVVANKPTYFEIFTAGAGKGKPEVVVLDPAGRKDTVPAKICPGENDTFRN